MSIGTQDILANGVAVAVGNLKGVVIGCEQKRDQFGGPIMVHTLRLTHRKRNTFGALNRWEALKRPIVKTPNYSFIVVL
jgi:hypothetical protein